MPMVYIVPLDYFDQKLELIQSLKDSP